MGHCVDLGTLDAHDRCLGTRDRSGRAEMGNRLGAGKTASTNPALVAVSERGTGVSRALSLYRDPRERYENTSRR